MTQNVRTNFALWIMVSCFYFAISIFQQVHAETSSYFTGTIDSIEYSTEDPIEKLTWEFDLFCLERPGFRTELPWDSVLYYGDVTVYDMAYLECPHGWDLHLMGNQYTTGLGSSKMAVVYKVYPEEREQPLWVTVWFRAGSASIITENNRSYINAWVHPMYCEDKDNDCWIRMELPK